MSIGERIISLRNNQNITQRELARLTNINVSVLNRIELNLRPLRDVEIIAICDVFKISADYLLGRFEIDK